MGYTRTTTVSVHWHIFRLSSEAPLVKPSIRLEFLHHLHPLKTAVWEFVQAFSVINSFKKGLVFTLTVFGFSRRDPRQSAVNEELPAGR
jgi:hypothetical protein